MINVSTATKNAYLNHSASNQLSIYFPNLNLTLTNSDIVAESMNLSQIIESESVLTFKGCNASKFEIELVDMEQDVRGEQIIVSIQAGSTDSIVLFKGTVDDQNNINHEDITVKITAYDELYSVAQNDVTDWYAGLTFPMTVQQFRYSFFNHINISQETVTLPCDDLQMSRMVSSDVALNVLKVMQDICQANARFGLLQNGLFTYVKLSDTTETAISKNTYNNVDYDPYTMEAITKVSVSDDSGVTEESYGSGTNILKIEGNIVAYSVDRAECAERIYDEVSGITMNSARVDLIGLPYLECGDYITLSTSKNDLEIYILNRTLKGIQALTDNYSSTIDKYQHEVNSVESQLITRDGRMNHFYRDLDQTKSTVASNKTDADGKFLQQQTAITQNADSISAEILRAQGAESTLSNTITATANAFTIQIEEIYAELDGEIAVYYREGEPTLLNYPAWDFTYNIPCNNTVQTTEDLTFLYTNEYYQQNIRDLVYDTDSNLTYRFEIENGTYYWKPIAQSDFSVAMQKIADLEVTTDQISATVSATTTELHSNYYTKNETNSQINQTAESITSTVSKAQGKYDLGNNVINYFGYGAPSTTQYPPASNNGKKYLDNDEGYIYTCNGSSWVKSAQALPLITTELSTRIGQTADSITLEAGYRSSGDTSTLNAAKDYADAQIVVSANAITSSVASTYETKSDALTSYGNLQSTITQTASDITSEVAATYETQTAAGTQYDSLSSRITQNADAITSKVSKGAVSSEISQEAGQVSISANRLVVNSDYFTLDSDGEGTLGGLTFDQYGFYSEESGSKVLRVHPDPANGWALSVGADGEVFREYFDEYQGRLLARYKANYPFSVGHEGEVYITRLHIQNEYTETGQQARPYSQSDAGQLFVDDYIRCLGNIEIGVTGEIVNSYKDGYHSGSLYVYKYIFDNYGDTGNVIADNYIYATGDRNGSGDIEAHHDLIYGNSCHQSSDERLKKDIEELKDSEEFIYNLHPVSYRFKDNDKELHRGFIAQEVEPLVEEDSAIVGENPRTKYKTLAYTEIIADLVKTVQLQNERIKALEEKIAGLEEKI